jgi:hypothetical protein
MLRVGQNSVDMEATPKILQSGRGRAMHKSQFELKFAGEGVSPETVRAKDLAETLTLLERSVLGNMGIENEDPGQRDALLSLVGVRPGSNCLALAAAQTALPSVAAITDAVSSGDYDPLNLAAHFNLHTLSGFAVKRGWSLEFVPNEALHIRHAVIAPGREVPDPNLLVAKGTTTIYGRCERVSGTKPRANLRLLTTGELLSIGVSEPLAKKLAVRLYQEVGVEGDAGWRTRGWQIVWFRATRLLEYRPEGLGEAFQQLATAAGGRWDGTNAEDYVRVLRSEDDE